MGLGQVLAGSRRAAVDLLVSALAKARPEWAGLVTLLGLEADAALRRLIAREYLGDHTAPVPVGATREQWAVLVLTERERLTVAETATVLDRTVSAVTAWRAQAIASTSAPADLGTDSADLVAELDQRVEALAAGPASESVSQQVQLVLERVRQSLRVGRHRRQLISLAAVAGVLVLVAVGAVQASPSADRDVMLNQAETSALDTPFEAEVTRQPTEWLRLHQVAPPASYSVTGVSIGRDLEITTFSNSGGTDNCSVYVTIPPGLPDTADVETADRVMYRGRQAYTISNPDSGRAILWQYATNHWASLTCERTVDVVSLADRVSFERRPIKLPFRFSGLSGFQASEVTFPGHGDLDHPAVELDPDGTEGAYRVRVSLDPPTPDRLPVTNNGPICPENLAAQVCLTAQPYVGEDDLPKAELEDRVPALELIAQTLTISESSSQDGWFDAVVALP